MATDLIIVVQSALERATSLIKCGISKFDALHVVCSIAGGAEVFVTTDDRLLKRLRAVDDIVAMLPQNALAFLEKWYEN